MPATDSCIANEPCGQLFNEAQPPGALASTAVLLGGPRLRRPRRIKGTMPRKVFLGVWGVALAGFVEGQQAVPHSGNDHCFVAGQPALESATRQLGKRYQPTIWPDEEGHAPGASSDKSHPASFSVWAGVIRCDQSCATISQCCAFNRLERTNSASAASSSRLAVSAARRSAAEVRRVGCAQRRRLANVE